ncbi:MAG: hypothetical protein WC966_03005 [Bradymonadales bacterium]
MERGSESLAFREVGLGYAKAFIFGEYAVLEGHTAVVLALDLQAKASLSQSDVSYASAFERELFERLKTKFPTYMRLSFNTNAFYAEDKTKWGIGASSATCVAALDLLQKTLGRPTELYRMGSCTPALLQAIYLHRELQGHTGSGADVVAAALGGLNQLKNMMQVPAITRLPLQLPAMLLLSAKKAASTQEFLQGVAKISTNSDYLAITKALGEIADNASHAIRTNDLQSVMHCAKTVDPLLHDLGRILKKPIVCDEHMALKRRAERFGIVSKVSGAGGGDLSLLFAENAQILDHFYENEAKYLAFKRICSRSAPIRHNLG